jgi:hypothetical protein
MSQHIDDIITSMGHMQFYDPEVWDALDRHMGANLRNLADDRLGARLWSIEKNIQYLSASLFIDPNGRDDAGWTSFPWWLRARYWTQLEIGRRGLSIASFPVIPRGQVLNSQVQHLTLRGNGIFARVGQARFLTRLLKGELRFTPAASYNDSSLGASRADDEMSKGHLRPGQALRITLPGGRESKAIGDVRFSSTRQVEVAGNLVDRPYLMCSFSNEVDPRLIAEFPGSDAILVIFDLDEFMTRSIQHLDSVMPGPRKGLVPNDYYDPYYLAGHKLSAIRSKELDYAFQREVRFVIDPGPEVDLAKDILTTETRSFADIAALYDKNGNLMEGAGPKQLYAE